MQTGKRLTRFPVFYFGVLCEKPLVCRFRQITKLRSRQKSRRNPSGIQTGAAAKIKTPVTAVTVKLRGKGTLAYPHAAEGKVTENSGNKIVNTNQSG